MKKFKLKLIIAVLKIVDFVNDKLIETLDLRDKIQNKLYRKFWDGLYKKWEKVKNVIFGYLYEIYKERNENI